MPVDLRLRFGGVARREHGQAAVCTLQKQSAAFGALIDAFAQQTGNLPQYAVLFFCGVRLFSIFKQIPEFISVLIGKDMCLEAQLVGVVMEHIAASARKIHMFTPPSSGRSPAADAKNQHLHRASPPADSADNPHRRGTANRIRNCQNPRTGQAPAHGAAHRIPLS